MGNLSNVENKKTFLTRVKLVVFAACVLVALVVYIIFKSIKKPPFTPSIFTFGVFFMLFGIAYLIIALLNKETLSYFVASVAIVLGLLFILLLTSIKWYIILVIIVALLIIAFVLGLAFSANKLTLVADNETSDYKNYKQRRAEQEAKQQEEQNTKQEVEKEEE